MTIPLFEGRIPSLNRTIVSRFLEIYIYIIVATIHYGCTTITTMQISPDSRVLLLLLLLRISDKDRGGMDS